MKIFARFVPEKIKTVTIAVGKLNFTYTLCRIYGGESLKRRKSEEMWRKSEEMWRKSKGKSVRNVWKFLLYVRGTIVKC